MPENGFSCTPRCDPRIARSRAAVLAAAADLLAEEGFRGVSIEAVAARSGVAKTTIYRHWPSRPRLLMDAFRMMHCSVEPVDTGDLRDDLVALLGSLAAALADTPWGAAITSLPDAAQRDPELAALLADSLAESRAPLETVLARAASRGELAEPVDLPLAAMLLAGPLFYRRLVSRETLDEEGLVARIVDAALEGLEAGARPAHPVAAPE